MNDDWPILEGLVTTRRDDGTMHLAPMGPRVSPDWSRMLLRPFPTSTTGRHLLRDGRGVFHVTDDVGLIARSAVGAVEEMPAHRPADRIEGFVLLDSCRHYEFVVRETDESGERLRIVAEVVASGRHRDFIGFHRARHAVIEAAILATRVAFLSAELIAAEFERLGVIVDKTAGPAEREAFEFLRRRVPGGG